MAAGPIGGLHSLLNGSSLVGPRLEVQSIFLDNCIYAQSSETDLKPLCFIINVDYNVFLPKEETEERENKTWT